MKTGPSHMYDADPPPTRPGVGRARRALEAALRSADTDNDITRVTVDLPAGDPGTVFAALTDLDGTFWRSPRGDGFAALGEVESCNPGPDGRAEPVRRWADGLWPRVRTLGGDPGPPLRVCGGIAFRPGEPPGPPWTPFGAGRFVLPRWTFHSHDPDGAMLDLVFRADERGAAPDILGEYDRIADAVTASVAIDEPAESVSATAPVQMDRETWRKLVEEVRAGIAAGRFRKVVLARRCAVELALPPSIGRLLARLDATYPDCIRFAARAAQSVFLGATPERLVNRRGDQVETEALAGSIGLTEDADEEETDARALQLVSDPKERAEHRFVVDAVGEALAPFCRELRIPDPPRVLGLRRVMHIHTPITGRLHERTHVLDLVDALHPTPAVGGVPTDAAVAWIAEREPAARGWYAGPVGWFDPAGDGEFAVALRCGVVHDQTVHVFAGAGIVEQSEPDREYEETATKQRALLGALGIEP